jgi:hypothetical protein
VIVLEHSIDIETDEAEDDAIFRLIIVFRLLAEYLQLRRADAATRQTRL